ncbi:MAG: tRNA (adenosine(37)-N6)-threonylcarbamoyltransferase complex ATPase subunit type 1 TsaE [Tepidisphaeraceae bacterium]
MPERVSRSLDDTARIAGELVREWRVGDCVALDGPMGAGKTTLVRSIVEALGGDPREVSSPTFALLNMYATPGGPVFHLDAYRVSGAEDFEGIGFDELLEQEGYVIVEWPSRVEDVLPARTRRVRIEVINSDTRRLSW